MNPDNLSSITTKKEKTTTLYKYRSWDNNFHRSILIHNKLYIPSIAELNDPFDFQLNLDFSLLDTDEKIEKYLTLSINDYLKTVQLTEDEILKLEKIRSDHKWSIQNDKVNYTKKISEQILSIYFKHFGVLCLSKVWNNILMWTHYSNNHCGFCIGFNKKKLNDLVFLGSHGPVNYSKKYPRIDPVKWNENVLSTMFIESHTKSIHWKYENEYRYTKIWHPETPTSKDRVYHFKNGLIDEVIIGLETTVDNENEIREICLRKNIPVYKVQKSDKDFVLRRSLCKYNLSKKKCNPNI